MKDINLKKFKNLFWKEGLIYYGEKRKNFIIDKFNKKYYQIICSYFFNDSSFETEHHGNLDKGLLIFGNIGIGKTTTFKILNNMFFKYGLKNCWTKVVSTNQIVSEYGSSKEKNVIVYNYTKGKILIDDLGSESIADNYGKEDILIRILELRYEEFQERGIKTHITTNLTMEQIKIRYGKRVEDRFYEMCNLIELSSESKRF